MFKALKEQSQEIFLYLFHVSNPRGPLIHIPFFDYGFDFADMFACLRNSHKNIPATEEG